MNDPRDFGAAQPMMAPVQRGVQFGHELLNHPIDTLKGLLMPPSAHEQGVQQINQQLNQHRNDPANESFRRGALGNAAMRPK